MATASLGLNSVPLFPCESRGKRPLTHNGFYDATRDVAQLELWRAQFPGCNWGMPTGRVSGIFVLDVDGQMGRDSLAALAAEGLTLPVTRIVRTGNGHHYYFAMPPGVDIRCSESKLAPGLDIRGDGGLVIAPGSTHANDTVYSFVDPTAPIADAPAWLLGRVVAPKLADVLPIRNEARQPATEHEIAYALKALREECAKFAALPAGTGVRNRALNTAAHSIATMVAAGWLDSQTAWNALWEAAKGYRAQDGDTEASNTMRSGWEAGLLKPREPLDEMPLAFDPNNFKITSEVPFQAPTVCSSEVEVKRMFEFEAKPIQWSWKDYLPKGSLTLLAGPGGSGKSTVALNLAAITTTLGTWPDGTRREIAENVLLWSSEDDAETILIPRLMAMSANPNRIGIISTVKTPQGRLPFDPARDIEGLKKAAIAIGHVGLIVIDPIVNCVTGDAHRANDVRRNLSPIVELARELGCAVIGISHFSKGSEKRLPAERVLGSTAFTDYARMVLTCLKDETSARCVFTRIKTNIAPLGGGFEYRLERKEVVKGIEAQYVEWDEPLEGSAREILASVTHDDSSERTQQDSKVDAAIELIESWLQNGIEMPSEELRLKAIQHQVTKGTYRRALKALEIVPYKQQIPKGKWVCRLPLKITTTPI